MRKILLIVILMLSICLVISLSSQEQTVVRIELKASDIRTAQDNDGRVLYPTETKILQLGRGKKTVGVKFDKDFYTNGLVEVWIHKTDTSIQTWKFKTYVVDATYYRSLFGNQLASPEEIAHYCRKSYGPEAYEFDRYLIDEERPRYYKKHPEALISYVFLIGDHD